MFVVLALVFDVMDGRVARWRHTASVMGRELDSLADVISFGVAPACLAFAVGFTGLWDCLVPAVLRRLRDQPPRPLQHHRGDDVGGGGQGHVLRGHADPDQRAPRPGADGADLARARWTTRFPFGIVSVAGWDLHPLVLVFALSGSLMISKTIHIPKP